MINVADAMKSFPLTAQASRRLRAGGGGHAMMAF
jgi:hypothetical protein